MGDKPLIDPAYVKTFAAYNRWQNLSLFKAAAALDEAALRADRGAFFGSVHATLNHLLWADAVWLNRLCGFPRPVSAFPGLQETAGWRELSTRREQLDAAICAWAETLSPQDISGELTYTPGNRPTAVTMPRALAIMHMFNHQTHHRGQVHALLTGLGAAPEATDLALSERYLSASVQNFRSPEK